MKNEMWWYKPVEPPCGWESYQQQLTEKRRAAYWRALPRSVKAAPLAERDGIAWSLALGALAVVVIAVAVFAVAVALWVGGVGEAVKGQRL